MLCLIMKKAHTFCFSVGCVLKCLRPSSKQCGYFMAAQQLVLKQPRLARAPRARDPPFQKQPLVVSFSIAQPVNHAQNIN